jgi:cytochrome c-type biogenesis protein CcmH
MRGIIQEKLAAGEGRDEILGYFVDRYGEGVLLDPPKRGFSLFVWVGPLIAALSGVAVVTLSLTRWLKRRSKQPDHVEVDDADLDERLEAELRRLN